MTDLGTIAGITAFKRVRIDVNKFFIIGKKIQITKIDKKKITKKIFFFNRNFTIIKSRIIIKNSIV